MIFYGFLILIFLRPFLSSTAYPDANFLHTTLLSGILILLIIVRRTYTISLQKMKLPLLLFAAAILLACLFSQDRIGSLTESYKYTIGLLLFVVGFSLSENEKIRTGNVLFAAGVVVSFLALYQYAFGFKHLQNYIASHNIHDEFIKGYISKKRIFVPFFGPNMIAGFLAMIAPLGLSGTKKKWLMVPIGLALLLTQSISTFASILLASLTLFYLTHLPKMKKTILSMCFWLCIGSVIILWIRIADTAIFRQPGFSASMRFQYWTQTLSLIIEHPFKGMGIGLLNLPTTLHAHNVFLEIWAETGMIGVFSFFIFIGRLLQLAKQKITSSTSSPLLTPIFAGVLIFLFHNLVDISFFFPETVFIWWLLAGILASEKCLLVNAR